MWEPLIGLMSLLTLFAVLFLGVAWWIKRGQHPQVTEWDAHKRPMWPYDGDY